MTLQGRLLWSIVSIVASARAGAAVAQTDDGDCVGGVCPNAKDSQSTCSYWMGPSPIKKEEEHGFGLGVFTGKPIPKGTTVESIFYGEDKTIGEPVIPLLGADDVLHRHPPFFEVLWDEDNVPELAIQYPDTYTNIFMPGLAAIAPCTRQNYNLAILGKGSLSFLRLALTIFKISICREEVTIPIPGQRSYQTCRQYQRSCLNREFLH